MAGLLHLPLTAAAAVERVRLQRLVAAAGLASLVRAEMGSQAFRVRAVLTAASSAVIQHQTAGPFKAAARAEVPPAETTRADRLYSAHRAAAAVAESLPLPHILAEALEERLAFLQAAPLA